MKCINCGAALEADDKYCQICGVPVFMTEPEINPRNDSHSSGLAPSVCSKCGEVLEPGDKYCQMCGTPTGTAIRRHADEEPAERQQGKNKFIPRSIGIILIVAVVAVFLIIFSAKRGQLVWKNPLPDSNVTMVSHSDDDISSESAFRYDIPYNSQIIRIHTQGSNASLTLDIFDEKSLTWKQVMSARAFIGKNGASSKKAEGDKCTPAGTFDLLFVFGTSQPDTLLEYKKVSKDIVWIDDPKSAYYNTWQSDKANYKDWREGKPLISKFEMKTVTYRIAFNFNGDCLSKNSAKSGGGSGLFIEGVGSKGKLRASYGDIRISAGDMNKLLKYLDSSKHPQIEID
ncbi:MAG: zinc ribbon domain-containing protein [Clostridia bacterium]|nr:zinc ribbon domain-containing protein [Clostridia bacterium]